MNIINIKESYFYNDTFLFRQESIQRSEILNKWNLVSECEVTTGEADRNDSNERKEFKDNSRPEITFDFVMVENIHYLIKKPS